MVRERGRERRRSILLVGVFTFLFHSIVPYFQIAAAESDAEADSGYTTTICTAYGYKTVFVALDGGEDSSDGQSASSYYECPTCIVQAHATGWVEPVASLFDPSLLQDQGRWVEWLSLTPESPSYPYFLSRAPPA